MQQGGAAAVQAALPLPRYHGTMAPAAMAKIIVTLRAENEAGNRVRFRVPVPLPCQRTQRWACPKDSDAVYQPHEEPDEFTT